MLTDLTLEELKQLRADLLDYPAGVPAAWWFKDRAGFLNQTAEPVQLCLEFG